MRRTISALMMMIMCSGCSIKANREQKNIIKEFDSINNELKRANESVMDKNDSILKRLDSLSR